MFSRLSVSFKDMGLSSVVYITSFALLMRKSLSFCFSTGMLGFSEIISTGVNVFPETASTGVCNFPDIAGIGVRAFSKTASTGVETVSIFGYVASSFIR